jgi:tRNA A-37 threonylcarbamoyl transferase component Bud32
MSFNVGETVGPYRIIEQLGQGGMATVYKAYHAALDRYVALKVLHPAFLEDTSFLARFQREARLVAKLDQPNIVPIYDYAEHEGRPYLVMKFIEGETLKARLSHGPLTQAEIAHVAEAVGAALGYAHKRGILHRDIKPSNVLLATDGQVYLADFGLARIAQSGESTLTSDMILGTPQYISPEQALGKKDLDEGTDIYSFGVMMYELIVGKVPFSADTPFSIIHDHIYSPLPLPRQVNPDVPEELERVLLKALAKERPDRYKDVRSMLEAFQQAWQVATPASAPLPTVPVVGQKPAVQAAVTVNNASSAITEAGEEPLPAEQPAVEKPRKRRGWMWLAVGMVMFLGCLVTFSAVLRSLRGRAGPLAALPPATLTPVPARTTSTVSDVARAEQYAGEHPDDPGAYLKLALAYEAAGLADPAQEAVSNFERTAAGDEAFLWDAGRQLAGQGAWLSAARLYVDAAEVHLKTSPLPDDLRNLLHEAVYKAFADKRAPGYIPSNRLMPIDEPLGVIAKARNTFYFDDQGHAQEMLDQLMQDTPGLPEGQLLQAEFAAKLGENDRAHQSLADLRNNPSARDWMLLEANYIEGNLK